MVLCELDETLIPDRSEEGTWCGLDKERFLLFLEGVIGEGVADALIKGVIVTDADGLGRTDGDEDGTGAGELDALGVGGLLGSHKTGMS